MVAFKSDVPNELKQVIEKLGMLISENEVSIKNDMASKGVPLKDAIGIYTDTSEETFFVIIDSRDEEMTRNVSKCFANADLEEFQKTLKRDPAGLLRVYVMVYLGESKTCLLYTSPSPRD